MNLLELSKLLLDEKLAEQYLLEKGILKTFTNCERCRSTKLGRIRRGNYKCYGCKAEWGSRKGSILHGQNISASNFIGLIKLFELGLTAQQTSVNLCLDLKTSKKLFHKVRLRIASMSEDEFQEHFDKIKSETQIMLISTTDKKISIEPGNETAQKKSLSNLKRIPFNYRAVEYSFQFTDVNSKKIKKKGKYFPTQILNFWRYAQERSEKYHGMNEKIRFLYLKEMEFRYNNRMSKNLLEKIVEKLVVL